MENLKDCLRVQMIKVGIRSADVPQQLEKDVLFAFMGKHFSKLTLQQIDEAFDLALLGKTGADPKCYGLFSCEYIGRILTAYVNYQRSLAVPEFDKQRQFQESKFEPKPLSDETLRIVEEGKRKLAKWQEKHILKT